VLFSPRNLSIIQSIWGFLSTPYTKIRDACM
jgi:hypothetical protein